jgi:diguanylate cyclase (GGDEF)-like protein/PAS domain S-box-containing protein
MGESVGKEKMNVYSIVCSDVNELDVFIDQRHLAHYDHILVQMFAHIVDPLYMDEAIRKIKQKLPQATIIGMTTDGGIANGSIIDDQFVISFTVFEKTKLQSIVLSGDGVATHYELGKHLVEKVTTEETKLLLFFVNGTSIDIDELIRGIQSVGRKQVIIGVTTREGECVFSDKGIVTNGVVAVSFNHKQLHIHTYSASPWQEVGTAFRVTKCKGKRLYELEGKKVATVLTCYLGNDFIERLPYSGMEFPFIIERGGQKECLQVMKVYEDGSIQVNRKLRKGEKVKFSYIHIPMMIGNTIQELKKLVKKPMEAIFLYSSIAMKGYLHELTWQTIQMMEKIAPTVGCFVFREVVMHHRQKNVNTSSFVFLALCEGEKAKEVDHFPVQFEVPNVFQGMMTLANLMNASSRDIERLHSSIEMSEQRYKSLFEHNSDIVYSTDLHGNFTSVNPAFEKILGYKKEEILYTNSLKYIHPKDIRRVSMHFYRTLRGKVQYYNLEIPRKSGETLLFQIKNVPIIVNGEKVGIYGIGRNITEQKKAEEKIAYLAYYDTDTHLPNRIKFMEIMDEHIERAKQKKGKLAILFINLDRFKMINDSIGHDAGDEILKQMAERIRSALPLGAHLGRFHGDQFSLLLTKQVKVDTVIETAKQISQVIAKPIMYQDQEFFITASIGISLYPNDGVDKHSLLKNADTAMNRAKQGGGNRIQFYSTEMNKQTLYRLELESYLRKALEKNELFLCYQPLIDVQTRKIIGSEALLRWRHPKLGLVKPDEFIPLAEETGIIHEVGRWVLFTACQQTKQWQQLGLGPLTVSVNVSANQFQQPNLIEDVKQALQQSQLAPCYLNLELTESSMLRNIHYSIQVMKELQQLGVGISIDDFGTGYSSLSYLKDLPIDALKIDRSFIKHLHKNTSDIAIVKAIVTMGHGLGIKVVAEGVETEEQMELLKALKCHYAQGYALYQPLMAEELTKYIAVSR